MDGYKKLTIVDVDVTTPILTSYEHARMVGERINEMSKGLTLDLTFAETLVDPKKYKAKGEHKPETVKADDGQYYIVEDDTYKLVLKEINMGKCPFLSVRILKETASEIIAVIVNPNNMIKQI